MRRTIGVAGLLLVGVLVAVSSPSGSERAAAVAPAEAASPGGAAHLQGRAPNPRLAALDAGEWLQVGDGTGPEQAAWGITDYSGMAFDSTDGRMLLFGGGHAAAYFGNGVWSLDMSTLRWTELDRTDTRATLSDCANTDPAFPGAILAGGSIDGARPTSRHTYDTVEWLPHVGRMISVAGYAHDELQLCDGEQFGTNDTWLFDPDAADTPGAWRYGPEPPTAESTAGCAAYADSTRRYYLLSTRGFAAYDAVADRWTTIQTQFELPAVNVHCTMTYAGGSHDSLFVLGHDYPSASPLWEYDLRTGRWIEHPPSGDALPQTGGWGLSYDSRADALVGFAGFEHCWVGAYDLTARRWTAFDGVPQVACDDVAFGRWKYDPVNNVHVLVNYEGRRYSVQTWVYRHQADGGGSGGGGGGDGGADGGPVDPPVAGGYWVVEADGDVHAFGTAPELGGTGAELGGETAVAMAAHPSGQGFWVLGSGGTIVARGVAPRFGAVDLDAVSDPPRRPGEQAAALAATASGNGLWVFTDRGRVLHVGDATPASSMANGTAVIDLDLVGPITGSAPTPTGRGVYLVGADGGLFAIGDAVFVGSLPNVLDGRRPDRPVTGVVADPDGRGYWMVAEDGGVFAFDAAFVGSLPGLGVSPDRPINGLVPSGDGYFMVADDGGVFAFATSFAGSAVGRADSPVVGLAAMPPDPS